MGRFEKLRYVLDDNYACFGRLRPMHHRKRQSVPNVSRISRSESTEALARRSSQQEFAANVCADAADVAYLCDGRDVSIEGLDCTVVDFGRVDGVEGEVLEGRSEKSGSREDFCDSRLMHEMNNILEK